MIAFDIQLFIMALVAFCAMFGVALAVRPELRDGRKLSRTTSYAIGAGMLIASILALETWRGAKQRQAANG